MDSSRSRALLVGATTFGTEAKLDDLPSVRAGVEGLQRLLVDPGPGGLEPTACHTLLDPATPDEFDAALTSCANDAEDTLLVYYAGHGIPLDSDGSLHLAVGQTRHDRVHSTAYPVEWLHTALRKTNAAAKVVILDCCFSGRAIRTMAGDAIAEQVDVAGSFVLTSAPANKLAAAPEGDLYTAFTGALLELLRDGVPDGPEPLDLETVFRRLKATLIGQGRPPPQAQRMNEAARLALVRNAAAMAQAAEMLATRTKRSSPPLPAQRTHPQLKPGTEGSREVLRIVHRAPIKAVAFSNSGRYIATAGSDGTGRVWEFPSGSEFVRVTHDGPINDITFSRDDRYVATASGGKTGRVWELPSDHVDAGSWAVPHAHKVTEVGGDKPLFAIAISPDGSCIATGGLERTCRVWRLLHGGKIGCLEHGNLWAVAFSPDGRYLATGGQDKRARVWGLPTDARRTMPWELRGKQQLMEVEHEDAVHCVAFSPDGRHLATGSADHTVRIWSQGQDEPVATMNHDDSVWGVAIRQDGRYLASASFDNTARVWEFPTGRQVTALPHQGWVNGVAFSPDGRYLVTASDDGTAIVWEVPGLAAPAGTSAPGANAQGTEIGA